MVPGVEGGLRPFKTSAKRRFTEKSRQGVGMEISGAVSDRDRRSRRVGRRDGAPAGRGRGEGGHRRRGGGKGRGDGQGVGLSVEFVKTDITSESSVQEALDQAASMGPVRISVAVHGGFGGGGRTLKSDGDAALAGGLPQRDRPVSRGDVQRAAPGVSGDGQVRAPGRRRARASSSTPRRSPATRALSARWPMPRPRPG